MKSKFIDIVKEGIAYNQKQILKLEKEIADMRKGKSKIADSKMIGRISEIIKYDQKLVSDFKQEVRSLKKRL